MECLVRGGGDLRIDLISIAVAIEPRTEAWYSIKSPGLHFISTIRRKYVCDETCDPRVRQRLIKQVESYWNTEINY